MKHQKRNTLISYFLGFVAMISILFPSIPVSATERTSPVNGEASMLELSSDIQIDGYYDDWNSYPVTNLTYTSNNAESIHKGQIYTDGEMIYVHFAMNDLYTNQIQMHQMSITINGESHAIGLYPVFADGGIDWDFFNNEMHSLSEGSHFNFGIIVDYTKYCSSQGVITIYDSTHQSTTKGDEVEFAFSIADFARVTGMNLSQVSSVTIVNPNIGPQGLSWMGTSTGPWLGVFAAFLLCGTGLYSYKKKKGKTVCLTGL